MKKTLRGTAIVITLIITLNGSALAAPSNDNLKQKKNSQTSIQEEREEIEMKIEEFDNEIQKNMAKAEDNKIKISQTEKGIEKTSADIMNIKTQAQKQQEVFNNRMRVMYINGFDSYANIILDSESFGDFVSRVENIKSVIEFDKKVASELEATKKVLDENQQILNKKKDLLVNFHAEDKQKLDKLIVAKASQDVLLSSLPEGLTPEPSVNKSIKKINAVRKLAQKNTPSRGSATISANAIIAYASNYLGTPYLWGGTTPAGFDCSGFTQYVFSHFGISIGRATFNQINDGVQVSKGNLQTGDLVFFGTNANPHHVGIYIGDNNYIHAPHTGDVIKVSPMSRKGFLTGRRVN